MDRPSSVLTYRVSATSATRAKGNDANLRALSGPRGTSGSIGLEAATAPRVLVADAHPRSADLRSEPQRPTRSGLPDEVPRQSSVIHPASREPGVLDGPDAPSAQRERAIGRARGKRRDRTCCFASVSPTSTTHPLAANTAGSQYFRRM